MQLVFNFDLASIQISKVKNTSPLKANLMMLVSRIAVVFVPDYWVITHCTALLIVSLMLISFWVVKYWEIPSMKTKIQKKHDMYVQTFHRLGEEFKEKITETTEISHQKQNEEEDNRNNLHLQLIPIAVLLGFYVIYGSILWGLYTGFSTAKAKILKITNDDGEEREFSQ
jgi:nitrogen fixation-related uncharacterized protein